MTDASSSPAQTPSAGDVLAFWAPGGAPALTEEALDLWACGYAAWGDYVARLAGAVTPAAWIDANTRLVADSLDLCTRATALRLRHAGVAQPLLADA